ncbi:MAG: replication initiation factor domain-containing protein [Xanthomonadaceae bacterium]|jgi:phage replication initiation protein|nr:replication initiation factor domain-containing protein [Xanthomonadaceae bacterium]
MAGKRSFSPVSGGEKGSVGPSSNTGQKSEGPGALIDYLTIIIPRSAMEDRGLTRLDHLLETIFSFHGDVRAMPIREKRWQFYLHSSVLVDRDGEMVGRIGLGGNSDTCCISLSGSGCKWVKNWHKAYMGITNLRGRISRVDVAYDDYDGRTLDVHALRDRAIAGDFAEGGCPPRHRFLSDEGHGTGSTLYVGGKGHKELCVYEKGKQLGLSSSPWVRAEVRLYGKHFSVPLDVLINPADYLRGSYSVLRELITGVCTRIKTIQRSASVSAAAMVEWVRRQVGPSLNLLRNAFGDSWSEFVEARILRERMPGRFRTLIPAAQLSEYVRLGLCQSVE